jgi:TonB family protein
MWREIIYSITGHAIVILGVMWSGIFPDNKIDTPYRTYTVKVLSSESIDRLMQKPSPPAPEVKPEIPQVVLKEDKVLPKKTKRPKQIVKSKTQSKESSSGETKKKSLKTSDLKGISVDGEFEYPEYLMDLQQAIQSNWSPPFLRESMITRVYFKIKKDGTLAFVRVEKGTGNLTFDSSTVNAVIKSGPFPPLPAEYSKSELSIHFDFIYEQ